MTSRDFAYWLQGFFEISGSSELSKDQVEMVKKHLNMVFYHDIDKGFGEDLKPLQDIHDGITTRTYDFRGTSADIKFNC